MSQRILSLRAHVALSVAGPTGQSYQAFVVSEDQVREPLVYCCAP